MPASDDRYPIEILRFVARFDRREFWLAHEELEELWLRDRRDFFKGLIQVAAGFLHIERGNWRGAKRLLATALARLDEAPATYEGFDVDGVRRRVRQAAGCVEELLDGRRAEFDPPLFFELAPLFACEAEPGIVGEVELPYRVRRYDEGYRPVRRPAGASGGRDEG